jgi:DNA-directed RNA polymerase subunit RPC12/RpoP
MKKIRVRCWKAIAGCAGENRQPVYFTAPDFGDVPRLYVCSQCGALFAVDPEEERYSKRNFEKEKNRMKCPECQNGLGALLPYPQSYRNESSGEVEHFERPSRAIPPDGQSIILEMWNPLS